MHASTRIAGAVRWRQPCRRLMSSVAAVLESRAVLEIRCEAPPTFITISSSKTIHRSTAVLLYDTMYIIRSTSYFVCYTNEYRLISGLTYILLSVVLYFEVQQQLHEGSQQYSSSSTDAAATLCVYILSAAMQQVVEGTLFLSMVNVCNSDLLLPQCRLFARWEHQQH